MLLEEAADIDDPDVDDREEASGLEFMA